MFYTIGRGTKFCICAENKNENKEEREKIFGKK